MARKRLFDQLQDFVNEQTKGVGPVSNLNGIIDTPDLESQARRAQQWYVGQVSANSLLDQNGLFAAFTFERPGIENVDADTSGVALYPASGASIPSGKAVFFSGLARVPATGKVAMRARQEASSIAIYIDGVQVGTGPDNLTVTPELSRGDHHILVVFFGGTKFTTMEVAPEIEIVRAEPLPPPPAWYQLPEPFLLEPERGTIISRMVWDNGSQASGWNLYRADTTELANIDTVIPTRDSTDGSVTFTLLAPVTFDPGDRLLTQYFDLGEVISATANGLTKTDVTIRPSLFAEADLSLWTELRVFLVNEFTAIAALPNAGGATVQYDDNKVVRDKVYLYKITAISPLGQAESDFSTTAWLWTNDDIPPQGIDWDPSNPPVVVVEGFNITVNYLSPSDADFAGVRVYGPYPLSETGDIDPPEAFDPDDAMITKLGSPLKRDQITFHVDEDTVDSAYFFATFDQLGNEQPPNTTIIRRNGLTAKGAFAVAYDGPVDPLFGANTSIELAIDLTDVRNTDMQTVLSLKVYPKTAVLKAHVDGVSLTSAPQVIGGRTYPKLTVTDTTQDDYTAYEVVLQKVAGKTVQFIGTSKGPVDHPMRPFTVTYKMDEDPFPGVSGVHVEDRKKRPVVYAVMDDDALHLRLVDTTAGDVILMTAHKTPGTNNSTNQYNTPQLTWVKDAPDMDSNAVIPIRIDASKDGTTWLTGVWVGSLQGPDFTPPGVKFTVTVQTAADGVTQKHIINVQVTPPESEVTAQLIKDNGQDHDVSTLTPTADADAFNPEYYVGVTPPTAIPGRYIYTLVRDPNWDQKFSVTAKANNTEHTSVYTVDRDTEAGAFVDVQDGMLHPIVVAIMDDDANALRIMKETRDGSGNVTALSAVPNNFLYRGITGNITLNWTSVSEFTPGQVDYYRVEASKENSSSPSPSSWRLAWSGALRGPIPGPTITLVPTTTATDFDIVWTAGTGTTVAITASGATITYNSGSATSATGHMTVPRPAADQPVGIVVFAITRNGITDQKIIYITPMGQIDTVAPIITITPLQPGSLTTAQQAQLTAQGYPSTWNPQYTQFVYMTVTNPNGLGVRIEYNQGIGGYEAGDSYETLASDTIARIVVVPRIAVPLLSSRTLHVRGTSLTAGVIQRQSEAHYLVDFDPNPSMSPVNVVPYPINGTQTGWGLTTTADDDTDTVTITVENVLTDPHNVTSVRDAATGTSHSLPWVIDASSNKVVAIRVDQGPGGQANIVFTPKKQDGSTGTVIRQIVSRPPITNLQVEDSRDGLVTLLFTTNPITASVHWTISGSNSHIQGATTGTDRRVEIPRPPKGANPMVIEYYSVAGGVQEEVQRMPIDEDDIANVSFASATASTNNRLEVKVSPDDDTVLWLLYARLNAEPNQSIDYLKYEGDRRETSTAFYASSGTWYLELVGLNWAGSAGPVVKTTVSVGGTDGTVTPTSGPALMTAQASKPISAADRFRITWTTNNAGASGAVSITWTRSDGASGTATSNAVFSGTDGTFDFTGLSFVASAVGVYKTYTFTVSLNGTSSSLTCTASGYFSGTRPVTPKPVLPV